LNLSAKPLWLVGRPPAQHESNMLLTQPFPDIAEPLNEKGITAQIGVRIERNQAEEGNNWFAQEIRRRNGHIQRRVIQNPLGTLHPVDDAPPFIVRGTRPPNRNARVFSQFLQVSHYPFIITVLLARYGSRPHSGSDGQTYTERGYHWPKSWRLQQARPRESGQQAARTPRRTPPYVDPRRFHT
jgi:hypothetical protein